MARHRLIEWSKTVLIVLLSCSAVLLTVMASADDLPGASLLERVTAWLDDSEPDAASTERTQEAAAMPVEISVRTAAGRNSALYDAAALSELYERFGGLLGQALEAADQARESTLEDACEALSAPGVYFRYPGALPLSVLAGWLDATCAGDAEATWFALRVQEDTVQLCFGTEETVYVSETYLQAERLSRELERYRPDGTLFAFESADYAALDPLTLLDPDTQHPVAQITAASVWGDLFVTGTASGMGFNPYGEGYYTEPDGTVVFGESGRSLRIGTDGGITLTNQLTDDARFAASDSALPAQIEAARRLLASLTQGNTGEAALYLTQIERDGTRIRLNFEYYLAGVRVYLTDGTAAEVVVDGDTVTELRVRVRSYASQGETATLLPTRQAAALADGGRLCVGYVDTGDSTPDVGWMN